MLSDLRLALRTLVKTPGFSLTAAAALALGIGANVAIFSLVDQVLLHPPGISQPERVVAVRAKYDKLNLKSIPISVPDFADVRDSRAIFAHAAIADQADFTYAGADGPERLAGATVTAEWFDVFGAKPALGRVFHPEEDHPGANSVIVLSDAAWKRVFGGNPGIVGKSVTLSDAPYRVIGVMGPEFRWPRQTDLWTPLGLAPAAYAEDNRFNEAFFGFARVRAGVPFARANAYIHVLADRLLGGGSRGAAYARDSAWGMFAEPFADNLAGSTRRPLLILLGAVGFVLLIACSNIAGLMLARTSGRAREIAVRVSLGANRWQLMRQVFAESLLVAAAGALAGLALADAGIQALLRLAPEQTAIGLGARMDLPVLAFSAAATVLSALLFGLVPAWRIARIDPNVALKSAGRSGMAGRSRERARATLVVAETALALLLLVGAGLFLRSLSRVEDVRPGFDPHGVMTAVFSLPNSRYASDEKRIPFYRAVVDRLAETPGVASAGLGLPLPFSGSDGSASFEIEEHPTGPGDPGPHGDIRLVSPGYFPVLRIPLRLGRTFTDQDRADTQPVAVIDENLARQYWLGANPVGQHIRNGSRAAWATIIGVVGHVHHSDLASDSGKGVYYYSMWQQSAPFAYIVLRTGADPAGFAASIRQAVRAVDPAQPVQELKTMDGLVANSLASRRFVVRLLGFFALAALLLAALGLYGVISYSVSERTREIGIRVALGAQKREVLAMVVGQGIRLAAGGAAIGLAVSLALGRWLQAQLFGIGAFDSLTLAVTAAVLLGAAVLASYLPARRAMRVNPIEALRWE
jgi:predicted permease